MNALRLSLAWLVVTSRLAARACGAGAGGAAARRGLRLPAGALGLASAVAVAWSIVEGGCGGFSVNCFDPTENELGADGGSDPCHCNVPPPHADASCRCTSGDIQAQELTGIQIYRACMALAADRAADGGRVSDGGDGGV
jgi:hypothetical protein